MAGAKESRPIELAAEQIAFLASTREKYDIPDESKVVRIMVDYLLANPDVHDTVFNETRCIWCG
jgi:hypothetical protein